MLIVDDSKGLIENIFEDFIKAVITLKILYHPVKIKWAFTKKNEKFLS